MITRVPARLGGLDSRVKVRHAFILLTQHIFLNSGIEAKIFAEFNAILKFFSVKTRSPDNLKA